MPYSKITVGAGTIVVSAPTPDPDLTLDAVRDLIGRNDGSLVINSPTGQVTIIPARAIAFVQFEEETGA